MTTFSNISNSEFRKAASEYFLATEDRYAVTTEQAENGHKALVLMYFGHSDDWTERNVTEAVMILEIATKRMVEVTAVNRVREASGC